MQLARAWGAGRVIATASSAEKRELALSLGADAAIGTDGPDLTAALRAANGGRRVDVVLEMAGGPVFDASLRALAPFGRLVAYGQASRTPPTPVQPAALMAHSTAVIGFWLAHCFRRPELTRGPVTELLEMVSDGRLRAVVGGTYPLAEAERAHRDLLARRTHREAAARPARAERATVLPHALERRRSDRAERAGQPLGPAGRAGPGAGRRAGGQQRCARIADAALPGRRDATTRRVRPGR